MKHYRTMHAFCDANGTIKFGEVVPESYCLIASGTDRAVRLLMSATARHGRQPGVLLVPGIPELPNQVQKMAALIAFVGWLASFELDKSITICVVQRRPTQR